MTNQQTPTLGYRTKPLWIRVIALALILAPLGNLLFTFLVLEIPFAYWKNASHWLAYIKPQVWALNVLLLLSGLALLKVRTWTHLLASFSIGAILIYNIILWKDLIFLGPVALAIMAAGSIVAIAILYSKQFRKPYFNPRLRWWETSPRYQAKLPIQLKHSSEASEFSGEILDISQSGIFLVLDRETDLHIGEEHHVVLPRSIELRGQVVRRAPNGYGLKFVRLSWDQRAQLKQFIEQLGSDPNLLLR